MSAGPALPLFANALRGPAGAPVVTFIPGIGNDRSFWAEQADLLADRYRVVLFDPWGHGDSPDPPADCGFDTIVDGLFALLDHLGVASSILVGLGFGGSLALAAAIARPERVGAVIACCCRPSQPVDRREFWRDRGAKAGELGMARMADITVDRWLSEDFRRANPAIDARLREAMKRTSLAGYRAHVSAFADMDFTARLGEIACPVQLVAAENDHGGGPVPAMRELAAAIPGAALTVIPGSGHICVAEAPATLSHIIAAFLAGPAAGAGG